MPFFFLSFLFMHDEFQIECCLGMENKFDKYLNLI